MHKDLHTGMQGQNLGNSEISNECVLSKAVVTGLPGHQVPFQILNPTAYSVLHIDKGAHIAMLQLYWYVLCHSKG